MNKALLYLSVISFGSVMYGQAVDMDSIFEPRLAGDIFIMKSGTVGEQFYNETWTEGNIKLSSGEKVVNKLLKYNALLDELIWFMPDSSRQVRLEKHFIDEFCFNNYKGKAIRFRRIRVSIPLMADSADIFVEVLHEKRASLYAFRKVEKKGSVNRIVEGVMYSFDKLVSRPVYIIILPDKTVISFKRIREGTLIKAFPEQFKGSVKDLILENNLSIRTENDLIDLVNLID
jgi:hypothetical protein